MNGVRVSVLLLIFALTFSIISIHTSAQTPGVTVLPMQTVGSVDSSFLVKVDPKTTERPIRIIWTAWDMGDEGVGSFPIVDGKGICYFSNDDENATCGPSPFSQTGETELNISVITPTKVTNTAIPLNISSLEISTSGVQKEDNTVYMYFYIAKKDLMKYTIYKEDLTTYQSNRPISYDATDGRYEGNITLNSGVYYFAFIVTDGETHGTALKRIDIPSADFLTIQTNKNEYWTGEKIKITGTTNSNKVTGEVDFPNGTKALDFSTTVKGDQTFSYEFLSKSNWPEGEYEIKTTSPLSKSVKFSIVEFFELVPESISGVINKSEDFTASLQLKNLRNETNVSLATTGGMKDRYVTIGDNSLNSQETTTIAIDITNVESNIIGTIKLTTPAGLELGIPVSVTVIEEGECPACPTAAKALEIDKDYLVWSQECVVDGKISYSILISNNGDSIFSDFEYVVEDVFTTENSLESLDSYGNIDVPVYDFSIDPGESEYLDMEITPSYAGKYQGLITISSGGDSAFIFVDLNCFEDLSSDLQSIVDKLSQLNPGEDVLSDISSDITEAQDSFSLENYQLANEYYEKAKAKLETLELGGGVSSPPVDLTWVIVIIIVVMVVIVVVWVFKFKKPQISEYEEETESLEGFE